MTAFKEFLVECLVCHEVGESQQAHFDRTGHAHFLPAPMPFPWKRVAP